MMQWVSAVACPFLTRLPVVAFPSSLALCSTRPSAAARLATSSESVFGFPLSDSDSIIITAANVESLQRTLKLSKFGQVEPDELQATFRRHSTAGVYRVLCR